MSATDPSVFLGGDNSERLFVESLCNNFDDTLPLPAEVEREFLDKVDDCLTAIAWLAERGVESTPEHVALIQYAMVWTPETGRYYFLIYASDHVGPKYPPELAIPIIEDGVFIDILFISDEMSFARATCRASWLGREGLTLPVVRLHAHPLDWLEAGCVRVWPPTQGVQ